MQRNNIFKTMLLSLVILLSSAICYANDVVDFEMSSVELNIIPPSLINNIAVSKNGKYIAYPYKIDDLWYIGGNVLDTSPQAVDKILPESITFSDEGMNIAYIAEVDDRYVVCAGKCMSPQFDMILKNNIKHLFANPLIENNIIINPKLPT